MIGDWTMGESVTQSAKTQATAPVLPLQGSVVVCKRYALWTLSSQSLSHKTHYLCNKTFRNLLIWKMRICNVWRVLSSCHTCVLGCFLNASLSEPSFLISVLKYLQEVPVLFHFKQRVLRWPLCPQASKDYIGMAVVDGRLTCVYNLGNREAEVQVDQVLTESENQEAVMDRVKFQRCGVWPTLAVCEAGQPHQTLRLMSLGHAFSVPALNPFIFLTTSLSNFRQNLSACKT